jgi:3-oxoacyl-[acyl-carrier-protein] synthase III
MTVQQRLGLRQNAHCFVVDSGCGGPLYMLDMVSRMLESGAVRTAAIIGTNLTSPLLNRELYTQAGPTDEFGKMTSPFLSAYVFGDGAGAIIVRRDAGSGSGIRASLAGNGADMLVRAPGGGVESPAYGPRYTALDHAFIVNGRVVAFTYFDTMRRSIEALAERDCCGLASVERFYLHQPNARVLGRFAEHMGLCQDQVASNVARVGNTSAAGVFTLLAADLEAGRVRLGSGTKVMFAAIGAGVHYGAQLAHL